MINFLNPIVLREFGGKWKWLTYYYLHADLVGNISIDLSLENVMFADFISLVMFSNNLTVKNQMNNVINFIKVFFLESSCSSVQTPKWR